MSPDDRFTRCVAFVCGPTIEGGYSDLPADHGGPTNHGITVATLSAWRRVPCGPADVRALTQDEATQIYAANYWTPIAGDQLPAGVDLITFDCAVNQGPGTAALILQQAVGAAADGQIGPRSLAAVAVQDTVDTIEQVSALRMARYRKAPGWPMFGKGWTNRLNAVDAQAIQWAKEPS